jgi:5-methylcytosine-specific restriction protein A
LRRNTNPSRSTIHVVRARDGGTCVQCWTIEGLQTHHRRPRHMGGTRWAGINLPSNLLTLCYSCHEYIERHRGWALTMGLLVSQYEDPAKVPVKLIRHGWVLLEENGDMTHTKERDT